MNNLQTFTSAVFGSVRIINKDGQPWFVGKDVAMALGYSNTRDALAKHVKGTHKADVAIYDGSQNRNHTIIDEAGLYSLVMKAKTDKAEAFQEWVTSEVLPSIRKTGKYEAPQAVPVNDEEPITDFTQLEFDQRIRIAGIIASCRRERLPLVAKVLSIDLEEMKPLLPRTNEAEQLAYQYISGIYDSMQRDTPIQKFYAGYAKWCMEQGAVALTKTALGKVLKKYFPVQSVATSYYEDGKRLMSCCRCYRKMEE